MTELPSAISRPVALPVQPENIPNELKDRRQWVGWRYAHRDSKWTKLPINPATGGLASVAESATWGSFAAAIAAIETCHCDGIGFVFTPNDPFFFADLDNCFDLDLPEPWAAEIIEALPGCYIELSPSRSGLHIIGTGKPPMWANRKGLVEIYFTERFATMTGHVYDLHDAIGPDATAAITTVHRKVFGPEPELHTNRGRGAVTQIAAGADEDILERCRRFTRGFDALWEGSTAGYGGDDSSADAGLLQRILWANGGDVDQAVRIARMSGLARDKWQTRRGNTDYLTYSARNVLALMTSFYGDAITTIRWPAAPRKVRGPVTVVTLATPADKQAVAS